MLYVTPVTWQLGFSSKVEMPKQSATFPEVQGFFKPHQGCANAKAEHIYDALDILLRIFQWDQEGTIGQPYPAGQGDANDKIFLL